VCVSYAVDIGDWLQGEKGRERERERERKRKRKRERGCVYEPYVAAIGGYLQAENKKKPCVCVRARARTSTCTRAKLKEGGTHKERHSGRENVCVCV